MSTLIELAARCEQASGPNKREAKWGKLSEMPIENWDDWDAICHHFNAQPVTASLDAAMTLIPVCPMTGGNRYAVRLDSGFYGAEAVLWHECSPDRFYGHAGGQHEVLCLALCAAALRAAAPQPEEVK